MAVIGRRGVLRGLGLLLAAPAIVRVGSIMPVRAVPLVDGPTYDIAYSAKLYATELSKHWEIFNGIEWVPYAFPAPNVL